MPPRSGGMGQLRRPGSQREMKIFPLTHADPRPSAPVPTKPGTVPSPTDEALRVHFERYWIAYRRTVKTHFSEQAVHFRLYADPYYRTTIVRIGANGLIFCHCPESSATVDVIQIQDIQPPLQDWNIYTIQRHFGATFIAFDFIPLEYGAEQGDFAGSDAALREALAYFWQVLPGAEFENLTKELAELEGIACTPVHAGVDTGVDLVGDVYLAEPAGFIRKERWAFQLKHHSSARPSVATMRAAEALAESVPRAYDAVCLVTSSDLTSIGRHIATDSPAIRVWDRKVLNVILHRHPDVLTKYFAVYASALASEKDAARKTASTVERFRSLLSGCPTGKAHFSEYEKIGTEIIKILFPAELGEPRVQSRTDDGVERRDLISRNNRTTRFFQRIADRFDADFIIWDFKNYGEPINGDVVTEVSTYSNPALGKFCVVVARKGGELSAHKAQVRRFRTEGRAVLVISDDNLLEMVQRKEQAQAPEDVMEDLLDELLEKC